uniref:XyaB n=1 Tax=Xylariaceae sp. TaxID=1881983 RepID=A0A8E8H0W3_9PEZI|nr:XyaB [Xylariaceae sp.]
MAHLGLDDAILAQICEQCHISSQDIEDVYACTPLQSGMLVDSALYTHAAIHSLDSSIDLDRLCSALHQVIALNSALRTRIVDCDAGLLQVVLKEAHLVHRSSETDLEKFLEQDRSVSMNLGTPLARVTILNRKKLVTTYHHTIFDYRVLEFLFQDTWSIYQGMSPEAHTPFKKFVEYCHGINEKAAIAFWKGRFKSGTSTTFPSIPPEHSVLATLRATREILLTKAPPSALMPAYVEAAWALTASDYSSSDSIVFGSVLSGRLAGSSGAETAFGPTIATVPMQIDLKPNMTIQHVLKSRVESRRTLSTSPYLQYGLPKIRNVSNEARIASGFQTVLNILHKPASVNTPGFTLEGENETRHAYALVLTCTLGEKHVKVKAVFDGAVLPEGPMRRVLRQFEHRLKQLVSSPSSTPLKRLQCLNFGDTLEIMDWNGDVSKPIEKCLHELVASRAYEYPDDPAVKSWDGEATYGELSVMVDNLAQKLLKGRTFAAESPVCCILERSLSLVVAALAIMKVGGTCVPIDMSLPKARKEAIVRISGARLILTSPNYGEELETSCDMHTIALNREPVAVTSALLTNVKPHQAAYILYTSGSTGQPKGVVLEHRSLASSFTELEKAWGWTRGTRVLQFSAPAWDACALETIGTLLKGGCVCIPSAIERESGLGEYIKSAGVNFAIQTPTALRNLRPEEVLPGLQTLVSAGEPMPRQVFDTWSSKVRLFNAWGPCETSVCAATAELAPTCSYPDTIGNPVGCRIWIVDPEDTSRLLPIGAVGEMLVDGPGVARGYYAEPAKTEAAFIKLPSFVPGQGVNPPRVYCTGDLAKYNTDGTISFIGRQDNQVKIRGQRFELGEVEEVLLNHQRNCQVVATTHQAPDSFNKDLVAIITFGSGSEQFRNSHDSESELREISLDEDGRRQLEDIQNHAKASFPPYMIPTVWFVVASLPLTTSMKIDRKKIKTWLDKVNISASRNTLGRMPRTLTQPETPAEVALQLAWSSVLDIEQTKIGRESSFVRLGGDSITAMQVATRCRKQNLHITVAALLRKDTLAESAVEAKVTQEAPPVLTMDTVEEIRYRPLSPIQTFLAENEGPASHSHFNQGFLLDFNQSDAIPIARIRQSLSRLVKHHSMLRARFSPFKDANGNNTLIQKIVPDHQDESWHWRVHHNINNEIDVQAIVSHSQGSLDIGLGPVFAADVIVTSEGQSSIFLVAHHLVIDLVSWRVIWGDLEAILRDDTCSLAPSLPFPLWLQNQGVMLARRVRMPATEGKRYHTPWPKADLAFWNMQDKTLRTADLIQIRRSLNREQTARLMGEACNSPFNTTPIVLMLTAVIVSFLRVFPDRDMPALYSEGHGRDNNDSSSSADPSRTVGWFTSLFPLILSGVGSNTSLEDAITTVKHFYQDASDGAAEKFALQVLGSDSFKRADVEIIFNFAGYMREVTRRDALLKLRNSPSIQLNNAADDTGHVGLLSVLASIDEDETLMFTLHYNRHMAHQDRIASWVQELINYSGELASELPGKPLRLTTSDLPLLRPNVTSLRHIRSCLDELDVPQENVESMYPCTGVQEGILFAQLKTDSKENEYHDRFASKLSSRVGEEIKFDQIINAWRAVCQAHPILRTIFTSGLSDQGAFQQIVLRHHDPSVSVHQMPGDGSAISQVIARQKRPSLDMAKPPHHLTLYRESASVGYAVLEISHTILDARTFQLIWSQIAQGYSLNYSGIAQGNNFSDYVSWLQAQENEGWQYWREYMAGVEPCLFPRDPSALPLASNRWTRGPEVPFTDARRLNRFCQNQGVTVAMFMQAAWGAVLQLYTGMSIVCLGSLRSDQDAFPGAADILGPLVSMLPCKFSFNMETTAHSLLETAREDASNSMKHSGCSLARLHDDLGLAGSPLFDTAMTIQRSWPSNLGDDYLVVEAVEAEDPTEYSILIGVQYSHEKLLVRMAHHRSRLSDSFMKQVSNTFARVIDTMVSTPQQPLSHILDPVLSPKSSSGGPIHPLAVGTEEFRLLKKWNAKIPVAVETCIPDIFRAVAQSQPTAPAVCSWDGNLDYGKLDALSDCLAYQLRVDHGVGTGTIVAFACEKAASAVVIVLAISKAGAAFLPLDNSHPPERLRTVLADADVRLVLVNAPDLMDKMTACFPDGSVALVDLAELEQYTARKVTQLPEELAHCTVEPQHAGYIVYTSGSTGKPKGILLEHRNIATSAEHHVKRLGMTTQSRILQLSNFVFDVGLLDMIYAFFAGACVCMPSEAERMNDIAGAIRRMGANFVMCTPTYATLFNPQETPTLKTVVLAGEPVKQENVDTWAPHVRLINAYGPAETAVSSCQDIAVGKISQDIGNPSCCRYWIVNPENHDELCPLEVAGELIIEGPLVARGYVNNPQATAAAFISAPAWTRNIEFAGLGLGQHRFYKTGDLVTRVGETSIIYQGRKDTQVKIRGMRIELAEIENHLNREASEDARWAVELIKPRNGEEACLAAFFHLKDSAGGSSGHGLLEPAPETALAARKVLQREVPAYMVPDYYIRLQKLPTNSSMKTDRKTLRTIGAELPQAKLMGYRTVEDSSLPDGLQRSTAESEDDLAGTSALMQEAWAGVLNIPASSIRLGSHFFSLGGNSIRAMRLVGKLRASGYLLAVSDVFKSPTLTGMVHSISHLPGQKSKPNGVATHKHSIGIAPAEFQHFCALAKTRTWLSAGNIESAAPATDVQAWMLSVDQVSDSGWEAVVCLEPFPGQSLDLLRLRRACQQVVRNHAILRTIFIQDGSRLLQVALRSPPIEQVHVYSSSPGNIEPQVSVSSDMLQILPRFHLTSDGSSSCLRIDIEIHHAHYDAISFSHLLHDLNEAYAGRTISVRRPSFHEWISHATSEELASSQEFWRRVLKGSISCPLMPSIKWPLSGGQVNSQARTTVPLANLNAPHGTPATILKAAWACVLSQILEREDIIFGYVSANRFSNRLPDVEQVPGPCINLLPLRAFPESQKTIAVLVTELQQQLSDSLPHHQMGFRSIVKNCTRWPTSRFNSIVLFQNHESLGTAVKLGDVECMSTGRGQACDSADIWIVAAPESDQSLGIEIGYSTVNIPIEFAQWTLFYLESLLRALPANWERAVGDLNREVLDCVGASPISLRGTAADMPQQKQWRERTKGADPKDVVDMVLATKHFEYLGD